ncbi:MAG: hypothetical protein Q7S40_06625 [Opitutaceae bacterium]|nr:hypothetical protein [Opitutaceae bacterium]
MVAILQQRQTNAELRYQIEDLYRKAGHTTPAAVRNADPSACVTVSSGGISANERGELARLVVPGKVVDKMGKKLTDPPKKKVSATIEPNRFDG